jgi:hypothetical protein
MSAERRVGARLSSGASRRWRPGHSQCTIGSTACLCSTHLGMNVRSCRGQGRAPLGTARTLATPRGSAVHRELRQPRARAHGEARHGEQPEPLRARANTRRSGVRHEHERRRLLSLMTGSSARTFPGGEPGQAGRDLAPGPAALGAGHGLAGRATGRGPAGGMMASGDE